MSNIKLCGFFAAALLVSAHGATAQTLTVSAWGGFFEETLAAEI